MSVVLVSLLTCTPLATAELARNARPSASLPRLIGKWLGQDGHDFVGPSAQPAPSGVQDLHIRIEGIPRGIQIRSGLIQGHGGDEWQFGGVNGSWAAHWIHEQNATQADLYLEPTRVETGRSFTIKLTDGEGRTAEIIVQGGRADPKTRMATATLQAKWIGQDGTDLCGSGPSVGPDGRIDVHVSVVNLAQEVAVQALSISAPDGAKWVYGVNPRGHANAELRRNGAVADLYFQPDRDRAGQSLSMEIEYANGTRDKAVLVAGNSEERPVLAPKLPNLVEAAFEFRSGGAKHGAGTARDEMQTLTIEGLPRQRVVAAVLSNPAGIVWVWKQRPEVKLDACAYPRPMEWQADAAGKARIEFTPARDEAESLLLLRLIFEDGSGCFATANLEFPAISADQTGRTGAPRVLRPGDDLHLAVAKGGRLRLAAGTYKLDRTLVFEKATHLTAEPGATLLFAQPANAPAWTAAIKIHAGETTIEDAGIRFEGPVRWDRDVSYGPAIIGTTDNRDNGHNDPKRGIVLANLDIASPPPLSQWEEAPRTLRLISAANGRVEGCKLRGGAIELAGGPWKILNNEHLGTHPNYYAFSVISAHHTHDFLVEGNTTRAAGPSGKVWRFLVMTQGGYNDVVRNNTIADIGPRDTDTVKENAPEIFLTESYRTRFEGRPLAVSSDGRVLAIGEPQGGHAEPGDVVALLAGPHAGEWRRIAQRIDRTTYLIDPPLPTDTEITALLISANGYVDTTFQNNTIDARGGSTAAGFVLAGHLYGTRVLENKVLGCGEAFRILASPTESPVHWGWSHAPVFGLLFQENQIEQSTKGAILAVEHGPPVKTNSGRLYFSGEARGNLLKPGAGASPSIVIGDSRALDPGELRLATQGNQLEGVGASPITIEVGTVDGVVSQRKREANGRRDASNR
jgi:hypothetical protein